MIVCEEEQKRAGNGEAGRVPNDVSGLVVVDARRPGRGSVGAPERRVRGAVAGTEIKGVAERNEVPGVGVERAPAAFAGRPREREDVRPGMQVDDELRVLRSPVRRPELRSIRLVGERQINTVADGRDGESFEGRAAGHRVEVGDSLGVLCSCRTGETDCGNQAEGEPRRENAGFGLPDQ